MDAPKTLWYQKGKENTQGFETVCESFFQETSIY